MVNPWTGNAGIGPRAHREFCLRRIGRWSEVNSESDGPKALLIESPFAIVMRKLQHFYKALRVIGEHDVSAMRFWAIRRRGLSLVVFTFDMLGCGGRRIACIESTGMAKDR